MQLGVGLQGRVDISIKKADGRVLKQRIYNDLSANIHRELADRIDDVGNAFNSTYKPEKIKIYALGHAADAADLFNTNALATKNYDTDVPISPSVTTSGYTAELKYQVADFLFDANTDDFDSSNRFEADGTNTRIVKVELLNSAGSTILGVARSAADNDESDMGHSDLTGDVAPSKIDENDKVTITYTISFSSTASTSTGTTWIETLASTVKDAPAGGVTSPDPSIKSMKLIHLDAAGGTVTINKPDVTGNVGHFDPLTTNSYVYVGDPDIVDVGSGGAPSGDIAALGGTPTDPIEFPDISSPARPTGLQVLGVGGLLIGDHTITETDIPVWENGDNIKVHYYIKVANTSSSLVLT
jgi:hypothetical protein